MSKDALIHSVEEARPCGGPFSRALQKRLTFSTPLSKSTLLARHPYKKWIKQPRFATEEVNDVSILFRNHRIDRCRRGFYRRAGSICRGRIPQGPDRRSPAGLR